MAKSDDITEQVALELNTQPFINIKLKFLAETPNSFSISAQL